MPVPFDRLPAAPGLGLKPQHYHALLEAVGRGGAANTQAAGSPAWIEVHPQNYAMAGGPCHRWLTAVAGALPLSFHSVGLSLGSAAGPDMVELSMLARLVERYQPAMVSDHVSWSNGGGEKLPDLLPMPYTGATLELLAANIGRVQDRLGRAILVENPSRYLAYAGDDWDEVEFLHALCRRAGCGLLLDINNVVVSGHNLNFSARTWLERVDPALVGEIHVAGHATEHFDDGTSLKIDDHGSAVSAECLDLLAAFARRAGPRPVLIEWDTAVPAWPVLLDELARIDAAVGGLADAA